MTSDSIGAFVESQLQAGREQSGTGGQVDRRRLFRLLKDEGLSPYPIFALMALGVSDALAATAASMTAPDISRTFGLTPEFFTSLALVGQVISFAVPMAVARLVQNRPRRAMVVLVTQGVWCLLTGVHGLVTTAAALMFISVLDRATTSAQGTVSGPLMIDLYPPSVRVRVVSFLSASGLVTGLVATGFTGLLTGPLQLSWRGVFLVLGVVSLLAVLFSLGLRDPGYGVHDTEKVRQAARRTLDEAENAAEPDQAMVKATRLSMSEALRRIWMIPSMRIMLLAGMVGGLQVPVATYLQFHLANRFSLDASERSLLALVAGIAGLLSYVVLAPVGDRIFQRNPQLMFYVAGALGMFGALLSIGQMFVYSVPALVVFNALGTAFVGLTGPALMVGTMSVVPGPLRPHVGAMAGIFALLGSVAGTALLGGLADSMGIPVAVAVTTGIGMIAQLMSMLAGKFVRRDLDAVIEEVVEEEYVAHAASRGRRLPMLSIRDLDFSYGQTQVLFGVDLAVAEGEIVALLGVNGAGKSTLLRAISGLGISTSGSIRLNGHDITYLDAERRTRLGITQVPGGKAVFGDLSVIDNLRCYTFGLPDGERRAAASRIEDALAAFPILAQRRNLPAAALSGGEQQMLGLAKAFILRPRLLLIDELSLGLAPKVVDNLLDVVREINSRGTAVMLVEQSVNVALTVARRACFMERGQVRFDGPTVELRDNPELLRSVFLSGVTR
ncbi:MFS transporter [Nonomuraea angiospora]|uniref:ATP-binding protein n=1 Tax=Nonomuraea angiospora TaxID=46172 RepID=UPI00332409E0